MTEICDGLDNDCDDKSDEDCLTPPLLHKINGLKICGQDVIVATENGLYRTQLDEPDVAPTQLAADVDAVNIVCNENHLLWTNRSDPQVACRAGDDEPMTCRGQVTYFGDNGVQRITGESEYGNLTKNFM